ncbi:hypothetical protein NL676_005516 [Syzygium grande]|nr:hypothetical protein NL676_005516 [Syzygium grande]
MPRGLHVGVIQGCRRVARSSGLDEDTGPFYRSPLSLRAHFFVPPLPASLAKSLLLPPPRPPSSACIGKSTVAGDDGAADAIFPSSSSSSSSAAAAATSPGERKAVAACLPVDLQIAHLVIENVLDLTWATPAACVTSGWSGPAYKIQLDNFAKRLKTLYTHWNDHRNDLWGSSDVLAIAAPPNSEDLRYLKSSALNMWLMGYEFPETIMVFMKKQIHFLCSQKKADVLRPVEKTAKEAVGAEVVIHVKARSDDGTALMEAIFSAIHSLSKADGQQVPVVGYIAREVPEGKLLEAWAEKLKTADFQLSDVTNGLSELFAVKDDAELLNVKKAAHLTANVLKNYVVPKLENVIDEEKKVTHSSLMDETEKAILDPSRAKVKLKVDSIDICYPPIFQSGGEFDLRPSAASNDELLYYDSASVIICAVGSRYNSYCSNCARTFLIDANPLQSKAYEVLLKAHEAAISMLKSGNKLNAAYQAAFSVVEKDAPELLPNLTKSAGTGMGLEFRESGLNINAKNERIVKENMVFNVSLGFQNLQNQTSNPKNQNFSMLLADTVIVGKEKSDVATHMSSKAVKDVAYSFNEDEEEEERPKAKPEANGVDAFTSKTTLRSDNQESKEELRRQHQAELARQK